MKCIICKNERTVDIFSEEHVFPDSIGGTLIIKCVCKECNDKLGSSVDNHLVNHFLIQAQRQLLKIRGKTGKIPNPLEKARLSSDLSQEVRYYFDKTGVPKGLYIVPKIRRTINDDGMESVNIKIDKKDKDKLPSIINKMRQRKGLPKLTRDEIEKQIQEGFDPSPRITLKHEIDIIQFRRAILKIAYELAYYWLGQGYLEDKDGEMIRKCMLDNNLQDEFYLQYPIKGSIDVIGKRSRYPMWDNEPYCHIAFLMKVDEKIWCYVRVFHTFEGLIEVSNNASRYLNYCDKFISINPLTGTKRESDLSEEFYRIYRNEKKI
ncbi:HNH endonuclease [Clostridium sp. WILCCON 0269]|uniref:HNH endonuclease n=1 Tax=Candidatus Clostridium eludens TaxID=3381663 RepID=A0ABW8SEN6_9CLOT